MNLTELDKNFSIYIRLKNRIEGEYVRCISCGSMFLWNEVQNGHFIPRRHLATRFDERNCNPQCKHCNEYLSGNLDEYAYNLMNKHHPGIISELVRQSRNTVKYSQREIDEMNKYYLKEIKKLKC